MAATLKPKTVQQILQQFFKDEKTKITAEALVLVTELITTFIAEAIGRATQQTTKDGNTELSLESLEKILPQLNCILYAQWCVIGQLVDSQQWKDNAH